jgi:hypothetical protein
MLVAVVSAVVGVMAPWLVARSAWACSMRMLVPAMVIASRRDDVRELAALAEWLITTPDVIATIRRLEPNADWASPPGTPLRRVPRSRAPWPRFSSVGGAGAQPYVGRMRGIDVFGLVSETIAHDEPRIRARGGHTKFGSDRVLAAYEPTFVLEKKALAISTSQFGPQRARAFSTKSPSSLRFVKRAAKPNQPMGVCGGCCPPRLPLAGR